MRHSKIALGLVLCVTSVAQHNHASPAMERGSLVSGFDSAETKPWVESLLGNLPAKRISASGRTPRLRFSHIRLKTGVRLRYAEQGNRSGQPVIMLHGYSDSWFSYSRVLPLMDAKYHIYVLDQRGHGDSDRPVSGYTFPDFAADVLAFMDAKRLKEATIVGHSMGSFVAQHVAVAASPGRVTRLVLVGSATSPRNQVVFELQGAVNDLKDPVTTKFVREFQTSILAQPVPDEFMEQIIKESQKLPARVWRAVIAGMVTPNTTADLSKITARTLIIWGDQETVFSRAEQDALVAAIPNGVLKVYPKTGHGPNWERPEQFAKDLADFIK